ncbi:MAG: hypothetical protein CMB79_09475 [Filomicrobium sp.]|nr:hypothetical protein [Filomicrobium sp.]
MDQADDVALLVATIVLKAQSKCASCWKEFGAILQQRPAVVAAARSNMTMFAYQWQRMRGRQIRRMRHDQRMQRPLRRHTLQLRMRRKRQRRPRRWQ